jgi:hypothetical protein
LEKLLETKTPQQIVDDVTKKGITVDFTEDGTAFIPQDKLDEVLTPAQQRIQQLEQQLAATRMQTEAAQEADKVIREILGEDERYNAVYSDYQKARNWVNKQVIEYQKDNELAGSMSSGQALDYVFDDGLEQQFKENFPGMDLEAIITAEDSTRLFRRMLRTHVADDVTPNKSDDTNRFEKVLKKPSGLGQNKNTKSELSVLDRMEDLTQEDLNALDDKSIEKLLATMRDEELKG